MLARNSKVMQVAAPVLSLAGAKHDRTTDDVTEQQPPAKRVTFDNAMAKYKKAKAQLMQYDARRKELERQKAEIDAELKIIPVNGTTWSIERVVRKLFREEHQAWSTPEERDKQTCPWCKHTPKRRSFQGGYKCHNCNTVYHECSGFDSIRVMHSMCKGMAMECLGCYKPLG